MARQRITVLIGAAALVLFSQLFFFYYRDNFSTHYPVKAFSARAFRQFEIPFWNFGAGGGQPLAGNPNTLTFYPDNLLYLFLRPQTAFNLHFLIHLLAGGMALRVLARRYGATDRDATLGALMYVLSGPVISSLAFYNLITAVALIPLTFLAVEILMERPGPDSALLLGCVFGLVALAGEPVTALGALLCAAILAGFRFRRAALPWGGVAVGVAVLLATPLLISYGEIAPEVDRTVWKFSTRTVLAASFTPFQLAESVLGPFRGLLTDLGEAGLGSNPSSRGWPPLFLSSFLGVLVLPAFFLRGRTAAPYRWMIIALLFLSLGRFNPVLNAAVEAFPAARIIRYAEKFALPMTAAALVLVSLWFSSRERTGLERIGAVVLLIAAIGVGISAGELSAPSKQRLLVLSLCAGAILASVLLDRRGIAGMLTLILLGYWAARAAPVDWARPYSEASPLLAGPELGRIARPLESGQLVLTEQHERQRYRIKAAMLDPLFGNVFGLRYGLDRSPDAMYYAMTRIVNERLDAAPAPLQVRYLRLNGCTTLISRAQVSSPFLTPVQSLSIRRNPIYRYAVQGAAPDIRFIRTIIPVRSIQDAVRTLESPSFDEDGAIVASPTHQKSPVGAASLGNPQREGQTIRFQVDAPDGATLVINETYFSAWDVRAFSPEATKRLAVFPANLDRLGVVVPPGRWRVEMRFGRRRALVAATCVPSALLLLAGVISSIRLSRNRTASPAR